MRVRYGRWLAVHLAAVLAAGCGGRAPPAPVPVKGKVVQDDRAVPGVLVRFCPVNTRLRSAQAITGPDGSFRLECTPGAYKVAVLPLPREGIPEVKDGGPGEVKDKANPKAMIPTDAAVAIPPTYQDSRSTPLAVDVTDNGKEDVILVVKE